MKYGSDQQRVWRAVMGLMICMPFTGFLLAAYLVANHLPGTFSASENAATNANVPTLLAVIWTMFVVGDFLLWLLFKRFPPS